MNHTLPEVLPDIPRLVTALAEWLACVLTLFMSDKRTHSWKQYTITALFLVIQCTFLTVTGSIGGGPLWVLCMIVAIAFMLLYIACIHDCSIQTAFFHCAEAFIIAEFMAAIYWMLVSYYTQWMGEYFRIVNAFILIVIYGLISFLVLRLHHHYLPQKNQLMEVSDKESITAIFIGAFIFAFSNISFLIANTPFSGSYSYTIFQLRALIDLGGVAVFYAYHTQILNIHITQDMVKMEAILQTQYQQYAQSKEVTDNINYKYHDLKQYITLMRSSNTTEQHSEVLDKIEEEIHDYEVQNKTGNHVLDTLLSAKSITCLNQSILLTTVIHGELLSFMDVIDICSIFGNALDNAIEYEKTVSDPDKRMINLTVIEKNRAFIVIRCENYYEGSDAMTLEDKLPKTTKQDKSLHGYGLRSIQHAVHKYDGEMDIEVRDQWFRMKILIPMP